MTDKAGSSFDLTKDVMMLKVMGIVVAGASRSQKGSPATVTVLATSLTRSVLRAI